MALYNWQSCGHSPHTNIYPLCQWLIICYKIIVGCFKKSAAAPEFSNDNLSEVIVKTQGRIFRWHYLQSL